MDIQKIIDYLKEKSQIAANGMAGNEVRVEKSILQQASVYLEDYLYILENTKTQ
jgi:hypothetical protein